MDKKYKPIVAVVVLVILVAVLGIVSHVVMKYIPSGEKMDLNEYYGEMADGEIAIVLGTEKLDERGLVDGDRVYLPLNVVIYSSIQISMRISVRSHTELPYSISLII